MFDDNVSNPPRRALTQTLNNSVLRVEYRSITSVGADVLVSSDDVDISMSGGVSSALLSGGGNAVFLEAQEQAPQHLGGVVVTGAGNLGAKKIFHTAVLDYANRSLTTIELIRSVTRTCLSKCERLGFSTICFPALATGMARMSPERSSFAMLMEVVAYLSGPTTIREVTIALLPRLDAANDETVSRFFARTAEFLELIRYLEGASAALESMERAYRESDVVSAAELVAGSRRRLHADRALWESALSSAEPDDVQREGKWREPLEHVETDILRMPGPMEPRVERADGGATTDWRAIEFRVKEERRGALRALIAIRERDIVQVELNAALRGTSVDDDSMSEQRKRLGWLKKQLEKIEKELSLAGPAGASSNTSTPAPIHEPVKKSAASGTLNILHISDLHFGTENNAQTWYAQLRDDLVEELGCEHIDCLVVSGDIADRSVESEYRAAKSFLDKVCARFGVSSRRIVIVPGNHDINWDLSEEAYTPMRLKSYKGPMDSDRVIVKGDFVEVRDDVKYGQRMDPFRAFYEAVTEEAYPVDDAQQAKVHLFRDLGLVFVGLNSAWQLDHHYRARAGIDPLALNLALDGLDRDREAYRHCHKIAVWHHPIASAYEDRIKDHGFMERLAAAGFRLALHGHIHRTQAIPYHYDHTAGGRKIDIISAGTFGAPVTDWVPGHPLQYNLLRLRGRRLTVETRRRDELEGAWKPDAMWSQGPGKDPRPRYEVDI